MRASRFESQRSPVVGNCLLLYSDGCEAGNSSCCGCVKSGQGKVKGCKEPRRERLFRAGESEVNHSPISTSTSRCQSECACINRTQRFQRRMASSFPTG